jgi:hypothetical protein
MTANAGLAYALARLQARLGGLADAAAWRAVDSRRTAAHALAAARSGPLGAWVDGLAEAADPGAVEQHLQARWRQQVAAVAAWLPPVWRPAVQLFGTLGHPPGEDDTDRWAGAWGGRWAAALPPDAGADRPWRRPAVLLRPHLAGHDAGQHAGRPAAPAAAQAELLRLFRRHADSALAAFAYLALLALELEHLRGALVARAMFEAETVTGVEPA